MYPAWYRLSSKRGTAATELEESSLVSVANDGMSLITGFFSDYHYIFLGALAKT